MEVKHPVSTLKKWLELLVIAAVVVMPLALIAFIGMKTTTATWELITLGSMGTLVWWYVCYVAFWFLVP